MPNTQHILHVNGSWKTQWEVLLFPVVSIDSIRSVGYIFHRVIICFFPYFFSVMVVGFWGWGLQLGFWGSGFQLMWFGACSVGTSGFFKGGLLC